MARYIDADLLLEEVENNTPLNWTDSERELQEQFDYQVFKHMIEYQPTVDVVPKSEVAREIFEEIERNLVNANFITGNVELNFGYYLTLKKRYTEEGTNDG